MKRRLSCAALLILLLVNLVTWTYHRGVIRAPPAAEIGYNPNAKAEWIDRAKMGVQQEVLAGNSFTRGRNAGMMTVPLLRKEEQELVGKLRNWIPSDIALQGLILFAITWFKGIENYFEPWMIDEMYGVSMSAPPEFNYLVDPFTRQVAYHGLHEVGQLMVDQVGDDMGCTVAAIPYKQSWVLGRNFDFEGGRVFDEDKIVKWVFPERGNAYVSVIWAGMVGAVTGVNDHGIYISINAAGSKDFKRQGLPSTLVLLKVLQFSNNSDEALKIIRASQMFITDIFVMLDARRNKLYRVEKSPLRTEVIELTTPSIVTNHLISPVFRDDKINLFRQHELTSQTRLDRGEVLMKQLASQQPLTASIAETGVLSILRDKGEGTDGKSLALGNRRAIDSLIAAHSVVYNGTDEILYVSQGPGVSGAFTGFDLKASFAAREPVAHGELSADPLVSPQNYSDVHEARKFVIEASQLARKNKCSDAKAVVAKIAPVFFQHYSYEEVLGDVDECDHNHAAAIGHWKKSIELQPAYKHELDSLQRKIAR